MLIDWITARIDLERFTLAQRHLLRSMGDRIQRFNPATGEIGWESSAWDSVRSDSHQLTYRVGSDALWMQGSPARVTGDGDAVFGNGASAALDLRGCVQRMAQVLGTILGVEIPQTPELWLVSRIDVTGNLDLGNVENVRVALSVLRSLEGGRYRVSQQQGDTVYYSHGSRLRSGKCYAKGPHLFYLMKKKRNYEGREYENEEIELAGRILRLELSLKSQWLRERCGCEWYELTPGRLYEEWEDYFGRILGDTEVDEMKIEDRVKEVAPTDGQAKAALALWALIQAYGWQRAREISTKTTWYRNLKILRQAGFSDADFSTGTIVKFRRKIVEAKEVSTWAELRKLAA